MDRLTILLASGFYSGYAPIAPGTFGTLVAIPIFLLFSRLSNSAFFIALIVLTLASFWIADRAQVIFKQQDSGKIVIDEIVGYLFTMLWFPQRGVVWIILGFFLFRLTDIVKPFPARLIDTRIKNGAGVVLDDVIAGIYANLLMRGILFLWTKFS